MSNISPLHDDLVALLTVTRDAEGDLYAALDDATRDAPASIGEWSAKDVRGHLAAWRGIEARRLQVELTGDAGLTSGDPLPTEEDDVANARLHAERAARSWEEIVSEADASFAALEDAIQHSSHDALCECEGKVAGSGVSGVNHALAHLSDIARLGGDDGRYNAFVGQLEGILRGNHLPPRDSGVLLYNVACHRALGGDLDDARRLLRSAFSRRPDLAEYAAEDSDLAALKDELATLAAG